MREGVVGGSMVGTAGAKGGVEWPMGFDPDDWDSSSSLSESRVGRSSTYSVGVGGEELESVGVCDNAMELDVG